jgi:4-hydroxybenzoate polyprenyltransferase
MNIMTWIRAARVHQWTKNAVVFAAYIFALGDRHTSLPSDALMRVVIGAALFCLASSAVYLLNDLQDIEKDRAHPEKRTRPLAAGDITSMSAVIASGLLILISIGGAWLLHPQFGMIVCAYLLLQAAYTYLLKQVALVDVFVIAIGFVIRALAGALVLQVPISPWLLLCTLMLALFLALCKRRHEKTVEEDRTDQSRPSLENYNTVVLDQLIAIVSATTIVCYSLYTLWPDTVEKFGTTGLGYTIPFVMFGIFRYIDLVYRHDQGGRPEKILLTDLPTLINIALYGAAVLSVLFLFSG